MPEDNNFSRDMADITPEKPSELYRSVEPLVDGPEFQDLQGYDREKIDRLKQHLQKGMTGLEYLTGIKKNKAETFYDKHPVQAVATDATKYAPLAGLGLAAGIGLKDAITSHRTAKADRAAIEGIPTEGGTLQSGGKSDPAFTRTFGQSSGDHATDAASMQKRRKFVDQLLDEHKENAEGTPGFDDRYNASKQEMDATLAPIDEKIKGHQESLISKPGDKAVDRELTGLVKTRERMHGEHTKKLDALMREMADHPASASLAQQGSVMKALEAKGLGEGHLTFEGLQTSPHIPDIIKKYLLPGYGTERLGKIHDATIASRGHAYSDEVAKAAIGGATGLDFDNPDLATHKGRQAAALSRGVLDSNMEANARGGRSAMSKIMNRAKGPLVAGGALALGGMGIHQLLKMLQNQSHDEGQINEWKRNLLKSRSQFDEAQKIQ